MSDPNQNGSDPSSRESPSSPPDNPHWFIDMLEAENRAFLDEVLGQSSPSNPPPIGMSNPSQNGSDPSSQGSASGPPENVHWSEDVVSDEDRAAPQNFTYGLGGDNEGWLGISFDMDAVPHGNDNGPVIPDAIPDAAQVSPLSGVPAAASGEAVAAPDAPAVVEQNSANDESAPAQEPNFVDPTRSPSGEPSPAHLHDALSLPAGDIDELNLATISNEPIGGSGEPAPAPEHDAAASGPSHIEAGDNTSFTAMLNGPVGDDLDPDTSGESQGSSSMPTSVQDTNVAEAGSAPEGNTNSSVPTSGPQHNVAPPYIQSNGVAAAVVNNIVFRHNNNASYNWFDSIVFNGPGSVQGRNISNVLGQHNGMDASNIYGTAAAPQGNSGFGVPGPGQHNVAGSRMRWNGRDAFVDSSNVGVANPNIFNHGGVTTQRTDGFQAPAHTLGNNAHHMHSRNQVRNGSAPASSLSLGWGRATRQHLDIWFDDTVVEPTRHTTAEQARLSQQVGPHQFPSQQVHPGQHPMRRQVHPGRMSAAFPSGQRNAAPPPGRYMALSGAQFPSQQVRPGQLSSQQIRPGQMNATPPPARHMALSRARSPSQQTPPAQLPGQQVDPGQPSSQQVHPGQMNTAPPPAETNTHPPPDNTRRAPEWVPELQRFMRPVWIPQFQYMAQEFWYPELQEWSVRIPPPAKRKRGRPRKNPDLPPPPPKKPKRDPGPGGPGGQGSGMSV